MDFELRLIQKIFKKGNVKNVFFSQFKELLFFPKTNGFIEKSISKKECVKKKCVKMLNIEKV